MFEDNSNDTPAGDVTKIEKDSKWNLIGQILKSTGLIKLQINSFNDFIEYGLNKIMRANQTVVLSENPPVSIRYEKLTVEMPTLGSGPNSPKLTPQMCRTANLTYAGRVIANIQYSRRISNEMKHDTDKVEIARLPIMLQSNRCHLYNAKPEDFAKMDECPYDPGCYFIVGGTERIVFVQEQNPYNRILVEPGQAVVNSSTSTHKTRIELLWKKDTLALHHNALSDDLPVFVVFRAFGITTDQEIIQLIDPKNTVTDLLMSSLQETIRLNINTQEAALSYIEKLIRFVNFSGVEATREERAIPLYKAREFLRSMVLPHIPSTLREYRSKAIFFGLQCRWLLQSIRDPSLLDGRDFFGNKRLELAGELMELLFEDLFKTYNLLIQKSMKKCLSKSRVPEIGQIKTAMRSELITQGLAYAISSGNWNITRFKMKRAGVSQPLGRMSYIQFVSLVTRISSHFEKTQKVSGARSLYPSQFGFICPSDTPEGAQCGLIKNFSLTAHVTVWSEPASARRLLYDIGVEDLKTLSGEEIGQNYVVLFNGEPIGITRTPKVLLKRFKEVRRHGLVNRFIAIWLLEPKRCVFISSEAGRVCRPLIIVDPHTLLSKLRKQDIIRITEGEITFDYLLDNGIVEYVDINEMHDCLIAFTDEQLEYNAKLPKDRREPFTHVEIDNAQILGVCAGVIPAPHHNQSPRNTYQCAMGKQAIGPTALNIFNRFDKSTYFNVYPQQPMVQTRTIRLTKYHEMPSGQSAMIAVMSYSGHDIEDAIVMNKASIDRGFGRRYYLSKLDLMLKRGIDGGESDHIIHLATSQNAEHAMEQGLDGTLDRKSFPFCLLDDDGLIGPNQTIEMNQVYANKFVPFNGKLKDQRARYMGKYPVVVHSVALASSDGGQLSTVKIKTRDFRRPEYGDKFSSRHGQKGTIGLIVEQEDMPFTESGICPDLIMNPHGFPSRMTVGKMIELISGKAGLFTGRIGNGTCFSSDRVEDISKDLIAAGFSYSGKEMLMSGITGEPCQAYIFFGPVFYQSLKHMVKDKMQARAKGRTVMLTRQPTQGRAKEGGMRLGEMERDCLLGHGASSILYERMLLSSDVYEASVCSKCGLIGYQGYCHRCKSSDYMKIVRMPYACKLLFQELISMGVTPRLHVGDY